MYNKKTLHTRSLTARSYSLTIYPQPGITSAPDGFLNQCTQGCSDGILLIVLLLAPFVFPAMTAIGGFSLEENLQVEGAKIAHCLWFLIIGVVGTVATAVTYALLVVNALHGIGGIMGGTSI